MYYMYIVSVCTVLLALSACSSEVVTTIDKPTKVGVETKSKKNITTVSDAIKSNQLELADKLYLDFRGKYPDSNRLATMVLNLSKAHMDAEEYLLARYYAEAYIGNYSDGIRVDQAWYLRAKSIFLRHQKRDSSQDLADQFKAEAEAFLNNFPKSRYKKELMDMLKESQALIKKRNEEIAKTYEKMGKIKAAKYYRDKNKN